MIRHSIIVLLFLIAIISCDHTTTTRKITTDNAVDSISYYTGVFTAWTLRDVGNKRFNTDAFHAGMIHQRDTGNMQQTLREADFYIGKFLDRLRTRQADQNLLDGRTFLEKNKLRKEITVTNSGLQYETITEGNGRKPSPDDSVVVKITGTLIDGREFASATADGPQTIAAHQQELKGLSEGLALLRVGSTYKFYLPTELAFSNHPPSLKGLKPNVPVVLEVTLISILPHKQKM